MLRIVIYIQEEMHLLPLFSFSFFLFLYTVNQIIFAGKRENMKSLILESVEKYEK